MKKKRAIRNYTWISIFIVLTLLLTVISFPVPGTNYNFLGLANMHLGLDLGGGVKNTYDLEVADWYEGTDKQAYIETVNRIQNLLNAKYADARVYLNDDDKITIEVPDKTISDNYLVGFIEMKSKSGADATAEITGQDIAKVEYMLSGTTHGVYLEFTEEGKKKYEDLTHTVSESSEQKMYIYMNKDYDNPFSEPTVSEVNNQGYTFISGSGITNKETGLAYAAKLQSALIGVNMTTDLDDIEVSGIYGSNVRLAIIISTVTIVVATIVIAYILFKQLGLVASLSLLFSLMVTVVISAIFDLQVTMAGWLGFVFGYLLNFALHMYYLNNIKKEYAMGKKFVVSFTSSYKKSLFNILDILLVTTAVLIMMVFVPSHVVKMFTYNTLMSIVGTAFTSMYLIKVVTVNYTAFNLKNEKKVNFKREETVNEIE